MIISHENRFIFLKTRKTAGTSVEIALSLFCGPRDVITLLGPADEEYRAQNGGIGAQNYGLPLRMYGAKDWARLVLKRRSAVAYNHMTASEVRTLSGREVWDDYLKISIVRNPWDMVVSWYFWKFREDRPSLLEVLRSDAMNLLVANRAIYSIGDTVVADAICRFESLDVDLKQVQQRLGIAAPIHLPHAKSGTRPEKLHYRDFINNKEAEEVRRLFSPEIERFGYEF